MSGELRIKGKLAATCIIHLGFATYREFADPSIMALSTPSAQLAHE